MSDPAIIRAITRERLALATMFEELDARQLATPSLCEGWTVHDVAAHLTMPFNVSGAKLLWNALVEPMSISGAMNRLTKEQGRRPIEGIVAQLRDQAGNRKHPPGMPIAPLVDLIVHGEDVRRPLGITADVPFNQVAAAMTFVTGGRAVGFAPGARLRGLQFVATDGDRHWGHGQVVHGPALSMLLAALGRRVAFAELGGAVQVLRDRIDPPADARKRRGRRSAAG
ncbi:MAG: hypothetical protein JWL72_2150 [Ilumatobacteraceae bacterium]|nr:hypothetical protein [Ilumatobacteraceae bacterium]